MDLFNPYVTKYGHYTVIFRRVTVGDYQNSVTEVLASQGPRLGNIFITSVKTSSQSHSRKIVQSVIFVIARSELKTPGRNRARKIHMDRLSSLTELLFKF